jgi:hypothetical protein
LPDSAKIPFFGRAVDTAAGSLGIGGGHFGEIAMNITASGRSAAILAAGLWMCIAGPLRATETDARAADPAATAEAAPDKPMALNKSNKHHSSKKVTAKSRKTDNKSDSKTDKAASKTPDTPADDKGTKAGDGANMPAAVANANAQLPADMSKMDAQADGMQNWMGRKPDGAAAIPPEDNAQVVSADQLNEVDRALSDDKPIDKPALTLAKATIDAPVIVNHDDAAWDKTSLIGKIFIAFGGLLTMASAARMFMA